MMFIWCLYCWLWTNVRPFSCDFITNFAHIFFFSDHFGIVSKFQIKFRQNWMMQFCFHSFWKQRNYCYLICLDQLRFYAIFGADLSEASWDFDKLEMSSEWFFHFNKYLFTYDTDFYYWVIPFTVLIITFLLCFRRNVNHGWKHI